MQSLLFKIKNTDLRLYSNNRLRTFKPDLTQWQK